jgi:hypothetical protein
MSVLGGGTISVGGEMTTAGIRETAPASAVGTGTSGTRWAALSGILFAALVVPGVILTSGTPGTNATASTVRSWYLTHKTDMNVSALLVTLGLIAGLFFLNYVRSVFRRYEATGWLTSLYWVGAILFAMAGAIAAGLNAALGDNPQVLSAGSLQVLNTLSSDLNYPLTCAGLAVMYLGAGLVIYRTRVLPRWLAWVSWILAVLAATFFLGFIALIATAVWVIVVAVLLAIRNPAFAEA